MITIFKVIHSAKNPSYQNQNTTEECKYHLIHKGDEAPESIHLILHYIEDGRKQIAHALHVAWTTVK